MKNVTITATFPEVTVEGSTEPGFSTSVTAEATTLKAAVSRAVGLALKSPELYRKRYKQVQLSVVVNDVVEKVENGA